MKKPYEKPEIYSEDVSVVFAQNCCSPIDTYSGMTQAAGAFCTMRCTHDVSYEYLQC